MLKEIVKFQPSRRLFLTKASTTAGLFLAPSQLLGQATIADRNVTVSSIEVFTVSVTNRTNWIIVSLNGSNGITGLGEASVGRRTESVSYTHLTLPTICSV